jgi:hypothetical protein
VVVRNYQNIVKLQEEKKACLESLKVLYLQNGNYEKRKRDSQIFSEIPRVPGQHDE